MPRPRSRRSYSIVYWPGPFAIPAASRSELIAITKLESQSGEGDAMVREVERALGDYLGANRVLSDRPTPAEVAAGIRELVRAARRFTRALAQQADESAAPTIEAGKHLLRKLDDIHDAMYPELTLPTGTPSQAPVPPRLLVDKVTEAVSCLIRPDIGNVDAAALTILVEVFCTQAESAARRLARRESRGRSRLRGRAILIDELTAICCRYGHPEAIENLRPEREAPLHPEQLAVDFVNVALDAAGIERPLRFRQCAKLVPH